MNVVSTTPSGTEICYALGVEPVAVSRACDYPPEALERPRIDASRIGEGSSAERHRRVADAAGGGHVYDVDAARLRAVEPDLIVTQEVCGVCAVDAGLVEDVLGDLDVDPEVLGLDASRLGDVFGCIRAVGAATGTEDRAEDLVGRLRGRVRDVARRADDAGEAPRVAVVEWMDPVHAAGNWVPEMVELAGGAYGLADPGEGSAEVGWGELLAYDPEVVIVAPCSYPVERTRERIDELTARDGWGSIAAVRDGRVYAMDGSSYLSRWSPRLVDALERLAAAIDPDVFGPLPGDVSTLAAGTPD